MLKKKWKQKILDFYVNFFLKKCKINNNILITSTDGIGDNIIRLNLLEEIFKHYNKSKCYIVCDNKTTFLIKKIGFENIIVFTKNMRNGLFGKIKLLTFLFKIGFCKIISLEYDQHDFDIQYFDNIVSYSYDNKFHSEMNKYYKILIPSYFNTTEESVINYFKVLFKKNISETEVIPNLLKYYTYDFNKQEHNSLAIGIGAGARFKMLKPILFSKILKIIVEKKEINKIYFLGAGKRDEKYLNEFKKYMDDNYFVSINLVDKISMNESIDIILKCKYYLGFDSGLFHIASALGIKTFGIFTKAHEFSHSHWDNVTIFTGNENNSLNNEYWGNPVLNNISIDNIKKTL